jgi:MFS transporter, PAT family, beta-lactamase induction signal transducer AmpG
LPGMVSGAIQDSMGYPHFFIYVCICTLPSLVATWFLKIPAEFGKRPEDKPMEAA